MLKNKIKLIVCISFIVLIAIFIFSNNIFGKTEQIDNSLYDGIVVNETKVEKSINIEEKIKVHIIGEVVNPGLVELISGSRIYDAIELAGGVTDKADISKTNLAYILSDGEKIYIPNIEDAENISSTNDINSNKKINLNTAKLEELRNIPGVGESTANSIIDYRNKNGKFMLIEDIQNVSGIGQSKFEKMKDYITVK